MNKTLEIKYLTEFLGIMNSGTEIQKDIAKRWLKGERIDLRTLKNFGFNYRIEDTNTSIKILSELIKIIVINNKETMFLLMIDEMQRIGELNERQRNDVNTALHTLFNALPDKLTILLSFSVRQQEFMCSLLNSELESRANTSRIFELSPFNEKEAKEFITQLIGFFKINTKNQLPFSDSCIDYIISFIKNSTDCELKPRDIIEKFNEVLEHADLDILNDNIKIIDENFAKGILVNK